jgi:16S rRNA pseudouridine516 synthase
MNLTRMLQSQGFGTRRACRNMIVAQRLAIAGEIVADPELEVNPVGLTFCVDAKIWQYREKAYLMLHKPAGYECSRHPKHHPGVLSLLPPQLIERGVQTVGRLDEDTTGLLLLTDDGAFIHALTSSKKKVPKVYRVTTKHPIDDEQLAALVQGVTLHDEPEIISAAAEKLEEHSLRLTITSGKYHQVKRMVAASGNRVTALHREAVGPYVLPQDLAQGEWRWLTLSNP